MYLLTNFIILSIFIFILKRKIKISLPKIVLIAILLRLFIILFFLNAKSNDTDSWKIVGNATLLGKSIYPEYSAIHAFFPFYLFLCAFALLFGNLSQMLILKIIFLFFDMGVLMLIHKLSKKNHTATLLYAINPIVIIAEFIHGQFDIIPLFFLLLGIYLYGKKQEFKAVLSLSVGIMSKTWPVLFILPLFKKSKRKFYYVALVLFPLLITFIYVLFFKAPIKEIIFTVKDYRGIWGWGFGRLIDFLPIKNNLETVHILYRKIFLMGLLIYSLVKKDKNIISEILSIMLFFFVFTPITVAHYLVWIIPFLLLVKPRFAEWFFIASTVFLVVANYGDIYVKPNSSQISDNLYIIFSLLVWLCTTIIFINKTGLNKSFFKILHELR